MASAQSGKDDDEQIPILMASAASPDYQTSAQTSLDYQTSSTTIPTAPQVVTIDEHDVEPLVVTIDESPEDDIEPISDSRVDMKISEGPFCRDWPFSILFWLQIIAVVYLGETYSSQGWEEVDKMDWGSVEQAIHDADDVTPEDFQQFHQFVMEANDYVRMYPRRIMIYVVSPAAVLAFFFCFFTLSFLLKPFASFMVTASLYSTVCATVVILISMAPANPGLIAVVAFIVIPASIYYVQLVWPMIPFASINLKVALTGIQNNFGVYLWAFLFSELCFWWICYWHYTALGLLIYAAKECYDENPIETVKDVEEKAPVDCDDDDAGSGPFFVFLLVSLYWTGTVMLNSVQVTVSGVMATWCYDKEAASSCCSSAVWMSLFRSLTYSFGSICFGSLLQGVISVIRSMINDARNRRDNNGGCDGCCTLCTCVLECTARILQDVLDYFNQWAYVFVGVYGYSYVQSGRKAMELFKSKGWMSITTERLAAFVLGFITFAMGIVTGLATIAVGRFFDSMYGEGQMMEGDSNHNISWVYGPLPSPEVFGFVIGFVVGCGISAIIVSVIKGAVNTLIVCWADSPDLFEANHPELTKEMMEAWSISFPEIILMHTTAEATPIMDA